MNWNEYKSEITALSKDEIKQLEAFATELNARRFWKEKYIGNYAFYCGLLSKGDIRLGMSIGNREASVDLFNFTFGYMKS